jgi:hypothetical protein
MISQLDPKQVSLLRMLTARLERLSVDSIWARRASGLRRSLVKTLERVDSNEPETADHLQQLIEHSMEMLKNAARELPDPDNPYYKKKHEPKSNLHE